ncbi:MAG: 50S ribosomal protein L35 [Saprospiraceae bacterium]|jgi:large subunit ribosomal protein L35
MPKMKTNSSAKKRFKVTGSGKIKRNHAFARHQMRTKTKKAKLRLRHSAIVKKCDEGLVKDLLCM